MITRIAGRGHSFKGAGLYYLHDKEALTDQRVSWTQVRNMPVRDPEAAMNWMAYTSINANKLKQEAGIKTTGRKRERGTVYTFSLSWSPEENPDKEKMIKAADETLETLGLQDHQTVLVAHNDTDHPHIHIITNLVNPNDGRMYDPDWGSKFKLSDWALQHEFENGKVYCDQRLENKQERERGNVTRYQEPRHHLKEKIQNLYSRSDNGQAFSAALKEQGFSLAQGNRRRFVLVDDKGKVYSLSRQLDKDQRKEHLQKLSDLKRQNLPLAKTLVEERQQQSNPVKINDNDKSIKKMENTPSPIKPVFRASAKDKEPEIFDRDAYETEWQKSIVDAAVGQDKNTTPLKRESKEAEKKEAALESLPNDDQLQKWDRVISWDRKMHRKRLRLEDELKEFYKPELLQAEIKELKKNIESSDNTWGRITGKRSKLTEELEALEKERSNMEMRMTERRQWLEREIKESRPPEWYEVYDSKEISQENKRKRSKKMQAFREAAKRDKSVQKKPNIERSNDSRKQRNDDLDRTL